MSVIFIPKVQEYLDELVPILYENGYFVFESAAHNYVESLIDDIMADLPTRQHRPAPPHFDKYGKGMYYTFFRKNKRTTWYVFFTKYLNNGETIYLVRYIANNHVIAQFL
ncbi:MAG: hypothetical protein FWG84_00270 [Bacteroidales bacterium]|nr:hypothetical protein [Bacteroidales bacterium]